MKSKETINTKLSACQKRGMNYCLLLFFLFLSSSSTFAQSLQTDTLKLSRQQFEELFLKQNLFLIAERLNINKAEAFLLQAKLWPNPSVTIDGVNLWSTRKQLANLDSPLPPIFGNVAKNTQFSIQLEQLIQTAGKRKKLMEVEKVAVDLAKQEFEDILRILKYEFRNHLTRLQYLELYKDVFALQQQSVQNLLQSYQKQVALDNISQGELIRLKALQLELSKDIVELTKEKNEAETELKVLLSIPASSSVLVNEERFVPKISEIKEMRLDYLFEQALEYRPGIKIAELENRHYAKLYNYEKSLRVPDLTLMSSYDRGGGIWPSYLGFGVSIDLPLFNKNQGNIKSAEIGLDQTKILEDETRLRVQAEVSKSYTDLLISISHYESIDLSYEQDLETLLNSYTRNFANRNISLLEYLDFQSAYLENNKIILESQRDIHLHLEELHYTIGKEIK